MHSAGYLGSCLFCGVLLTMATFGKPVGGNHRLKKAFLKATLAGLVTFACYDTYAPDVAKHAVENKISHVTGIDLQNKKPAGNGNLQFVFENQTTPDILGEKSKAIFNVHVNVPDMWFAMVGRHDLLMQNDNNREAFQTWMKQFDGLKGKDIAEKARAVDAAIDTQITYATDPETSQKADYWSSPMETLQIKKGDCEDFAILKYYTLRELGVPADKMFVVAVGKDGGELDHATLMVNTRDVSFLRSQWEGFKQKVFNSTPDSHYVILDNDNSPDGKLVEARDSHYEAHYAMNEKGLWTIPANSKLKW